MYLYLALISVLLYCFNSLYLRWSKIKNYWSVRGVPHQPAVPFLGSFTFLQRENIGNWLRRLNEKFSSPYIGIWIFWRPALIVNSPELARKILVKDFDNFRNRFLSSGDTDPVGSLTLLSVNDPLWSILRRNLGALFTGAKLRIFQDYTRTKAKELVQRIHSDLDVKSDLKKMYVDYTTDVIGTSAFGVKSDATLTGVGPLRDVANDFSKYSLYRSIGWCCIFFIPELVNIFRFKFFPSASIAYFKKIFKVAMVQRETCRKNKEPKDLLDFLIDLQKDSNTFSEDVIIAQAAIILFGGFDTSANLLTYITYELAHRPEIQDKIFKELLDAIERNGSEDFTINTLSELTYLNCVIKETLRFYLPMGWIDRVASRDYKIDDKLTIEAGTVVYVNSIGMHFNPKYFPEPHKFNPDRFLPENKNSIEPYTYMPFGEGPRVCIGKRFGLMTAQFAMASVLLNYEIRPYPGTPQPSEVKISTRTVWYIAGEILHVKFIPRSKAK